MCIEIILLWYKNIHYAHFSSKTSKGKRMQPLPVVHFNKKCSFQLWFLQQHSLNMRLKEHRGTCNGHPISLITYPVPADSQCLYSCEPSPWLWSTLLTVPERPLMQIFAQANFTHTVKSSDLVLLTWTWMGLLTWVELLISTNLRMRP